MAAAMVAPANGVAASRAKSVVNAEQALRRLVQDSPGRVDGWYQLGLLHLREHRFNDAVECLSRAAELDPAQPLFHHYLADCLQALGRPQEAASAYGEVVRLKPECAEAHNNLGIALARQGCRDQAAASFDRAIQLRPDFPEAHNNRGNVLVEAGRYDDAIGCFQRALTLHADYAEAHHNLGYALARLSRGEEAIAAFQAAIRLRPTYAEAHYNLANLLRDLGRLPDAVDGYRQALSARADYPDASAQLATVLARLGRLDEAAAALHQCLLFRPDSAETYNNLGIVLAQRERLQEAAAAFRQALRLKPDFPESLNNLGNTLLRLQNTGEAIGCFRRAIELRDDYAQPHCNLGSLLVQEGRAEEALGHYQNALRLQPDFVDANYGLGNALRILKRPQESVQCYERALRLQPEHAGVRLNLASAVAELGRLDESCAFFEALIKDRPDCAEAHSSLGVTRLHQGRPHEALECYARALELKPDEPDFHLNRALTLLSVGDYAQGWPEYEWRWRTKRSLPRPLPQPTWDGSPLPGGTILLYAEQGMGDTLQFIRYAMRVKERVGTVLLECPGPLRNLLAACPGVDAVVDSGAPLPPFDVQAPLLSLPRLLGTTVETIPGDVPYLLADVALRARWHRELESAGTLKVGIAWQGNPQYAGDRFRSVKLAQFRPIAEVPGVQLFSLQKGTGSEQLNELDGAFEVKDMGSRFSADFRDGAALVSELDLVISVDSAIAHLAGGLGVPVWVMLPYNADWRWLRGRDDSPWYPSARLFRQERWGDWDGVFARLAEALRRRVQSPRSRMISGPMSGAAVLERLVSLDLQDGETDAGRQERLALQNLRRMHLPQSEPVDLQVEKLRAALVSLDEIVQQMEAATAERGGTKRAAALIQSFVQAPRRRSAALSAIDELLATPM